jgi:hypothetical protein
MRASAAATLGCISALVLIAVGDAGLAEPAGATSSPALTKSTHFAYGECAAKTTVLKASLDHLTFAKGQAVVVHVTITNTSTRPCGDVTTNGSNPPPLPTRIVIGICGQVSLQVDTRNGHNIFPGLQTYMCPFIPGPALSAHGSVSANGTWNQVAYPAPTTPGRTSHAVAAGRYRLIIGGELSFPITVKGASAPSSASAPASGGPCGSFFNLVASTPTPTPTTTVHQRCPIDQVAPPFPGSIPTPTVPPTTNPTTTKTANA